MKVHRYLALSVAREGEKRDRARERERAFAVLTDAPTPHTHRVAPNQSPATAPRPGGKQFQGEPFFMWGRTRNGAKTVRAEAG